MEWETYKLKFESKALLEGKSRIYIEECLAYANNLYKNDVPIIYNEKHFSNLVGYDCQYLYAVTNDTKKFYRYFEIDKKNGSKRKISEPLPSLKTIQLWILNNILIKINVHPTAKAYLKKQGIKDNVKYHRNQKKVLCLDIEKFFDNIKEKEIINVFLKLGYSKKLSVLLGKLCCLNKCLPQGAPTSPYLSNLIMFDFDKEILSYCWNEKRRIRYTRYADDLTFSGDFNDSELISYVNKKLFQHGLKINKNKTRLKKQHQQQLVTGVVVNKKMQIPKEKRKKLRQSFYYVKKYGLDSYLQYTEQNKTDFINKFFGQVNYALYINPKDKELQKMRDYIKNNIF